MYGHDKQRGEMGMDCNWEPTGRQQIPVKKKKGHNGLPWEKKNLQFWQRK